MRRIRIRQQQIPQRIVDWRRSQQQEVAALAKILLQHCGSGRRIRVAVVVCLIDDHELILVKGPPQVFLQPPTERRELCSCTSFASSSNDRHSTRLSIWWRREELLLGCVAKLRWTDQQRPLTVA